MVQFERNFCLFAYFPFKLSGVDCSFKPLWPLILTRRGFFTRVWSAQTKHFWSVWSGPTKCKNIVVLP